MGLARRVDRQGPARLLVARQGLGAEHSVCDQERERLADLGVKVVAALWSIGGRLDVEIGLGLELPGCPDRLGNVLEPADLAMVTVRSSSRSARSLIGAGSLTIEGGTWSAAACRSLLVLVWFRIRNSLTLTRISRSGRWPSR